MRRKFAFSVALAWSLLMLPTIAKALPVDLTLSYDAIFQEQENNPCIFGNPSCKNPDGFDFTLFSPNTPSDSLDSPEYTVEQLRLLVGNTFDVGIDLQQAQLQYVIDSFTMSVGGVLAAQFSGPVNLTNHGNGFSDAVLSGFDLTSFSATDTVLFHLAYSDGDSEREQYFLIGSPVPEPGTLMLLGVGVLGAAVRRRRSVA